MGWFKRLCLFVYGLAGILALLALSLPWVGPYTQEATSLLYVNEYFTALEVLVGITGVGCLICLLRSIFTPRNYKNVIISSDGGDQITVTRSAIASQAQHIVERDGTCVAGTVRVRAKKRGSIRVFVRVTPRHSLDVVEKGAQLHAELDEGLAKIAADKIKSVNLEFTDPQEMDDEDDVAISVPTRADDFTEHVPAQDVEPVPATSEEEPTNDITVSMSSFHRGDDRQGDETSSSGVASPASDDATSPEAVDAVSDGDSMAEIQPVEEEADAEPGEGSEQSSSAGKGE